jgi:hypothetical protein
MKCSRCGADVGNGGLDVAARITDLDPDEPSGIVQHLLCRENGCVRAALTLDALRHFRAERAAGRPNPAADRTSGTLGR